MTIDWSSSDTSVRDLTVSILGLAAYAEGLADEVANAYVALLPGSIACVLITRQLSSAEQVALVRAAVEREVPRPPFGTLADDFNRLEQLRNDLAHSNQIWDDSPNQDRWRLVMHRGRELKMLPEVVTVEDLRPEVERAMDVRGAKDGRARHAERMAVFAAADIQHEEDLLRAAMVPMSLWPHHTAGFQAWQAFERQQVAERRADEERREAAALAELQESLRARAVVVIEEGRPSWLTRAFRRLSFRS